jgi:formylmethanofuran dehydrogenase subunit E
MDINQLICAWCNNLIEDEEQMHLHDGEMLCGPCYDEAGEEGLEDIGEDELDGI